MLRNILVGTQDENLLTLCQSLQGQSSFHLFTGIHDLSSKISEEEDAVAVFVDVEWPNSQNGYNIARDLKKRQDGSKIILLTDRIDEVKLHWCAKVNAELIERTESTFLSKLAPLANSLGIVLPDNMRTTLGLGAMKTSANPVLPIGKAEVELERILGPMGPLLLQEAMTTTRGDLSLAIKKVAEFGTTAAERAQIENLSAQFG
ncbi:MAG TPA: hypothetical protein VM532_02605 [Burkholderiales bacterium]|nr:hypothetical protein [Burkholderiales bacterium]